jgi:hypothetical protein
MGSGRRPVNSPEFGPASLAGFSPASRSPTGHPPDLPATGLTILTDEAMERQWCSRL